MPLQCFLFKKETYLASKQTFILVLGPKKDIKANMESAETKLAIESRKNKKLIFYID